MASYRHCIVEVATGAVVNIIDYGSDLTGTTPPGYSASYQAIKNATAQISWHWNGTAFEDTSTPPAPIVIPPVASIIAQSRMIISGNDISGIETSVGFAAAMQIDTGVYWVFFTEPQPDTDYGSLTQPRDGGGLFSDVSDQTTDYVELTITNRSGVAVDPTEVFISVQRTI